MRQLWRRPFNRRVRIGLTLLVVGFVVVLVTGYGFHLAESPVHGHALTAGTAATVSRGQNGSGAAAKAGAAELSSPYFTARLPSGNTAQANQTTPPGLDYSQTVLAPSANGSLIINIAIRPSPASGLSGDSSYRLRQERPSQYQLSEFMNDGETAMLASDTQAGGVVAFWLHGSYLATISASLAIDNAGPSVNGEEQQAITSLLLSWHWLV